MRAIQLTVLCSFWTVEFVTVDLRVLGMLVNSFGFVCELVLCCNVCVYAFIGVDYVLWIGLVFLRVWVIECMFVGCVDCVFACWTGSTIEDTSALRLKCSDSASLSSWSVWIWCAAVTLHCFSQEMMQSIAPLPACCLCCVAFIAMGVWCVKIPAPVSPLSLQGCNAPYLFVDFSAI